MDGTVNYRSLRKILITKWGALGDLIAGTTAIHAVRKHYPEASITLLANSMMNEVCPPGTLADEILVYKPEKKSIPYQWSVIRELRKRKFDAAINLRWTSERSALLGYLSGADVRVGSGPKESQWMYNFKAPLYTGRRHEFYRHLDILEPLGITNEQPEPFIHIGKEDRTFAAAFFQNLNIDRRDVLAIHPGASIPSKAWLPERYAETAKIFLKNFNGKVLVTWGPGEQALAESVVQMIGTGAVPSPQTSIGRLAALLEGCGLCICNYSGVMNVGMAVKTPLIALGCTSAEDWGPYGEIHRTINHSGENDSYTEEARAAMMAKISIEEVCRMMELRWRELHPEVVKV